MPPVCTELKSAETWRLVEWLKKLQYAFAMLASRSSNATSEGELDWVGTFGVELVTFHRVRPTFEYVGKYPVEFRRLTLEYGSLFRRL